MSKQKYLVMDIASCHDCNDCFMACKDEHVGNARWWMRELHPNGKTESC